MERLILPEPLSKVIDASSVPVRLAIILMVPAPINNVRGSANVTSVPPPPSRFTCKVPVPLVRPITILPPLACRLFSSVSVRSNVAGVASLMVMLSVFASGRTVIVPRSLVIDFWISIALVWMVILPPLAWTVPVASKVVVPVAEMSIAGFASDALAVLILLSILILRPLIVIPVISLAPPPTIAPSRPCRRQYSMS